MTYAPAAIHDLHVRFGRKQKIDAISYALAVVQHRRDPDIPSSGAKDLLYLQPQQVRVARPLKTNRCNLSDG